MEKNIPLFVSPSKGENIGSMLLSREQTIDEEIVRTLAQRPGLRLGEIIQETTPRLKKSVSLQAWYQALMRLREKYIIVKLGKTYSVNMSWMQSVERWGSVLTNRKAKDRYQESLQLPMREGVVQKYNFSNLLEMNAFWSHVLVYIAHTDRKSTHDNNLYGYLPRFWFYLAQEDEERQYIENLKAAGTKSFHVIGAKSFLDGWNLGHIDRSVAENYMSPIAWGENRARYVNVIEDYTLEVKLHKNKAAMLDKIFSETNGIDENKRNEVVKFLSEKSPCRLMVYRDATEREKFVRKVKRYF